jgi:energy-coupling factor transport system permease protein
MDNLSMYVTRESGLHHLHPLTKFAIALCLILTGLILPGNWTGYFLVLFVLTPLALWGKIFPNFFNALWKISLPFALSVLLIQGFLWDDGEILFRIGRLTYKQEGAIFSLISIGRIISVMANFILFAMATRPDMLMISAKQAGVPSGLAYIIVTTLQIIPRFQHRALTILAAQRSRGLNTGGNLLARAGAVLPLIMPLVLSSLVEVEERAIAIEARAFNSNRKETSLIEIPDSQIQKKFRALIIFIPILAIIVRILWHS